MRRFVSPLLIGFVLGLANCTIDAGEVIPIESRACTIEDASAVFDERIAPLLASDHKSTCNECHLAGVDLDLYAQQDPCATMACMVESGIVDLDAPDESLVLDWILRAKPVSELITDDIIEDEAEAMQEWIEYSARCGASVCPPIDNPCGSTAVEPCEVPPSSSSSGRKPYDDPGDCSDRSLEAGFAALVYSWRGRCYPCHFDSHEGAPEDAPRWIHDGACDIGAVETLHNLIEQGNLDAENPEQSLLLLKPISEELGGVMHGGHQKIASFEDPAYVDFLAWLQRWSACQQAPQ
ncbi:MAG: hypothetical protein IAG13_04455 [Deltaproteobacteria bacterium]|nr:hypothetical protein [Nannocystaceae bacterium]